MKIASNTYKFTQNPCHLNRMNNEGFATFSFLTIMSFKGELNDFHSIRIGTKNIDFKKQQTQYQVKELSSSCTSFHILANSKGEVMMGNLHISMMTEVPF